MRLKKTFSLREIIIFLDGCFLHENEKTKYFSLTFTFGRNDSDV